MFLLKLGFLIIFLFHRKLYISVFIFLNDNRVKNFIKWGLIFLLNFILIKFQHRNVSRIKQRILYNLQPNFSKVNILPSFVSISQSVHTLHIYTHTYYFLNLPSYRHDALVLGSQIQGLIIKAMKQDKNQRFFKKCFPCLYICKKDIDMQLYRKINLRINF